MENHILGKHARPDKDEEYKCDDCDFTSKDKEKYGKHFKDVHGSNANKETTRDDNGSQMVEEMRILKHNFERLEGMYQDSLEEVNNVKSEYEAKLIKANDNYVVVKAENEVLKEKADILFKLGRSYLDNTTKKKNTDKRDEQEIRSSEDTNVDDIQEVPDNEETGINIDDLKEWTTNKMRGFRRVSPSSSSTPSPPRDTPSSGLGRKRATESSKPTTTPVGSPSNDNNDSQAKSPHREARSSPAETTNKRDSFSNSSASGNDSYKGKYCHYFVNQGRCNYEERTGFKCKYEHKVAPMCNFGVNCSRMKCMFSHPKPNGNFGNAGNSGNNGFLGSGRGFPTVMNPWQMLNPWTTAPHSQFHPNPWNTQGQQNQQ